MKEILIEQNIHWKKLKYKSVKRDALDRLISYLPLKQIITITGIRRCGKSTLAKQAINYLIDNGVEEKNIFFINLENPYFLAYKHDATFLNVIFEEYLKLMNPTGKIYCLFDEIQYFDNWQVYIKSKYESSDIKYIITGSNSSMLSNDLNTLLSGRSLNIHLDTFSFTEFLDYKNIDYSSEFIQITNKINIARAKDEYLKWGGFYEVFEAEDEMIKKEILISYAKNIIYQDIVPRYKIRNSEIVEKLFFYLLSNAAGIMNYTTLAKTFEISDKAIREYINYFEDVFMLKRLDKFHNKPKERIKSFKKIYALDNGFLQIAPTLSKNLGNALENMVFIILNQKSEELYYLKDGVEIDFFAEDCYYQVSYDISEEKTRKREVNAFSYFNSENKTKNILITYNTNEDVENINIVSIEKFIFYKR
ncbi:MAG: ATPase [Sulfurimonas sp. RIFCSPHIGHO2_12_FULL_36_9]|uniref:ATP-binding protein n=1 Tax=Sulfurimonas sp. RIFCSPLOWO2_12_36_12 TaxID=1802253 RepID=UPI0008AF9E3B|nr:ATP-binding protein [Sulfurimonas sp. RIFCSPLOWO2_12_36_12]OHD98906.1 MAG: ATPase [Sulfurimonas sp. RIFCSPHIGHO2_12_FULL_36_9]OHE00715.1 MAG: ATPase [Sulfurimonas sp. RIFCSPLOWO2_02_FULL_36_28]OHE02044.1 MAG: ATPase [Sulfurimonas sp. RIFCSPLOWO2_12_36_12]